ncbi:branched-chain amino acid transport system ATP-binding protein [Polaromonas sp. OV174]|uniref:ABC transporter ATP-binding protein n=1 Tax=Polaromonas sp. OV174 TaxID=1855300 RepID=UPI0008EA33B5|nr:ABC transporter ATP-binding protein [Polaromonas sp. OV174]SFC05957.1 branched-chain amino acid transport system ATP-binding protein [Polaromonas sp. OV174]
MSALLSVRGLVKRYGGLLVTDHVDLDIHLGEIHAVIGPNGAGKTTLVNQIVGEVPCDQGKITLGSQDITRWAVARRARAGIGRSYQINSIIASFTVLENVLLAVQAAQGHNLHFWQPVTSNKALVAKADEVMSLLGLHTQRDRLAGVLAYGQQRQIELAMALAMQPKLLLLDEPMAGLGPSESEQMTQILLDLRSRYGILLIEHDMQAVFALAQRVSVLVAGKVAFCGSPQAVRESALVREAYLGEEEIPA